MINMNFINQHILHDVLWSVMTSHCYMIWILHHEKHDTESFIYHKKDFYLNMVFWVNEISRDWSDSISCLSHVLNTMVVDCRWIEFKIRGFRCDSGIFGGALSKGLVIRISYLEIYCEFLGWEDELVSEDVDTTAKVINLKAKYKNCLSIYCNEAVNKIAEN